MDEAQAMITPRVKAERTSAAESDHLGQLDGWRAISILAVLAAHMLPLGPASWRINLAAGKFGMATFFILSGFLITSTLLRRPKVSSFFIRRLCRILPLAFLYLAITLPWYYPSLREVLANGLFLENYLHEYLRPTNAHFWSLCVEIHFYMAIGLLVLLFPRLWIVWLPVACLAITGIRIWSQTRTSICTHLRVDEIMVGCCVAIAYVRSPQSIVATMLKKLPTLLCLALFALSTHEVSGDLEYARPYFAAATIGSLMFQTGHWLKPLLETRPLAYLATISYAVYVIHPLTMQGSLGEGSAAMKYLLKRPISLALTIGLAHLSTRYYEAVWIKWGKRLTMPVKAVLAKSSSAPAVEAPSPAFNPAERLASPSLPARV